MMGALIALIYFLIVTLCVAISAWATYHGFITMFGAATLAITIVVALGLFGCDLAIFTQRRKGQFPGGAVAMLVVFTAFSGTSNFSAFYTQYMRDRISTERLATAEAVFASNIAIAKTELASLKKQTERRPEKIEQELLNLKNEVRDETKTGFGTKALTHLNNIYLFLLPKTVARMKYATASFSQWM